MRTYNNVPTNIWIQPQYRLLNEDARVLLFYLSTNTHTNLLGCYRLPMCLIENELQWNGERVFRHRLALINQGLINSDTFSDWIWIKSFLTWNPLGNINQGKGLAKQFALVPSQVDFYQDLIGHLLRYKKNLTPAFLDELTALLHPAEDTTEEKAEEALKSNLHPASQLTLTINTKSFHLNSA